MHHKTLNITTLLDGYKNKLFTVRDIVAQCKAQIAKDQDNPIWITVLDDATIEAYLTNLPDEPTKDYPLYGIPFAIKDNIDLAGIPTSVGCPAATQTPVESAMVVDLLIHAGAIPMGKTNLDQFATGLVGTRSPFGACHNAHNASYISGGSSSGSALAVALGHVAFSLGTDTAGSGRVPAALNGLFGLKPSRGLLSTRGVVPACRTLDCVSIFANNSLDLSVILACTAKFDDKDPYARSLSLTTPATPAHFKFAVPLASQLQWFDDPESKALFHRAIEELITLGGEMVEIDFTPFFQAAELLYQGPWVAERQHAVGSLGVDKSRLLPILQTILATADNFDAKDCYGAMYRLARLRRQVEPLLRDCYLICTPTIPRAYTLDEVAAEPIVTNNQLGTYTNFMNLLDLCGLAIPLERYTSGVHFGITLIADSGEDGKLLSLAHKLYGITSPPPLNYEVRGEVGEDVTDIVVCGAHMRDLPLNPMLLALEATYLETIPSAPCYRFFALTDVHPPRPAMLKVPEGGSSIELEIWRIPTKHVGTLLNSIPAPLGLGTVECADGRQFKGFIGEGYIDTIGEDISHYGGWRAYLDAQRTNQYATTHHEAAHNE